MTERSEEVQDIIDRMPTYWCKWVFGIMVALLSVMVVLSIYIRYPETVDGQVSITATTAPVRLVAATAGRLHPLVANGKMVERDEVLAYIENGASYPHYLALKRFLSATDTTIEAPPTSLELGEMSGAYNTYLVALQHWQRMRHSPRYAMVRKSLEAQIAADQRAAQQLQRSKKYKDLMCANLQREVHRDSLLLSDQLISQEEMEHGQNNYYAQADITASLEANRCAKQADITRSQTEVARSQKEEEEAVEEAFTDMMAKRNVLLGDLRLWEEKYLLRAPMAGKVDYLGFWRENAMVQGGVEVFSILPQRNHVVGEAHISAAGAGKVRVGQAVNVKLQDFPYDEFGLIRGKVRSISQLTNKTQTENHVIETYLVQIDFPEGLITNFGHRLPLNFESKGTAEIITRPKRLYQRLFDNLKARAEK